jgi:hypothetical protein
MVLAVEMGKKPPATKHTHTTRKYTKAQHSVPSKAPDIQNAVDVKPVLTATEIVDDPVL